MEFCGLTDSPASILNKPTKCANCRATSRLGNGLCLNCLLHGALLEDEAAASSGTTLTDILAEAELAEAKWRIGNYEILDEIGRGGMGVIYRAREVHSRRIVALKRVLSYHADSNQTLARFRREAETATRLDHPNIVPIYCVGEDKDKLPFFTMKFASGGSLAQAREAFRREPRKSVSLMAKVALAVQYAHEQGVLHRDLKPSNILLSNRWEPMVSDFGLAKWIESSDDLTRTLTIFGTPGYIAPEQATRPGGRLTIAADVYNLGAILFELLTGRSPFLGEHALAVLQQVTEKPAPRLRSVVPHLDRDLETICARCLEREPSARYYSAGAVARDLNNWLEGRPIVARPVGIPVRLWRWSRRNRMLASMLGAFLLLAAGSVAWGIHSWQLQGAARESTLAQRSVAVLPFLDLDNIVVDENLANSVADSLQNELDRIGHARVKTMPVLASGDWATVEQILKAGLMAKARTVLTGTQRRVHGKTRISLRLADAATGEPLLVRFWEGNGEAGSTKPVGREIGAAINDILGAKDWSNLSQSKIDPGLRNQAAREDIMAGRELVFRYTVSDFDQAIALFRKALRTEPSSWLAHSYLAIAATDRTHLISDDNFLRLGEAEAYEAVRLSPDSGDAHRALAGVFYKQGKFAEALEEGLKTVESTGPEEKIAGFIGMTLDTLGRPDRAVAWHSLSCKLGGRWADEYGLLGDSWVKLCDDDRALQAYRRAAQLQPEPPRGEIGICHLRLLQGDFEGAREFCRSSRRSQGGFGEAEQIAAQVEFFARRFDRAADLYGTLAKTDADGGGSFYGAITYQSALGRARQALGDEQGAKAILKNCLLKETAAVDRERGNPEAAYRLAAIEASLGMSQRSIDHLKRAVSSGWIDYRSLVMDPRFDAVRQDPQVQTILKNLAFKVAEIRVKSQSINYRNMEE
jgi:tetratricopeptide (TPR) repeat protein/TolB-like protein/tRNA A-37 threonylcarbamoyl transferase component Bud32